MGTRFKDPELRKVYDFYLAAAESGEGSPLYANGMPRRGNSWTNAFWNGADGLPNLTFPKGSTGYAAYCAGRDWASNKGAT
jgi:hypothetical protein